MASAIQQDWWQRALRWMHENVHIVGWLAVWMVACLLFVFAAALWIASRNRCVVVFWNATSTAIHDVTLRPVAASSREPRHFLPHLGPGASESFVMYPLSPCEVALDYLDEHGAPHEWRGARVSASGVRISLRLTGPGVVTVDPHPAPRHT